MLPGHLVKPQFSTKIYRAYLYYLRTRYPDVDLENLCSDAGLPLSHIENESNWVSLEFATHFSRLCIERTRDHKVHYQVGRIALDRDLVGAMIHMFTKNLASASAMYRYAPSFTHSFTSIYGISLIARVDNTLTFQMRCHADNLTATDRKILPEAMTYISENWRGYYEAIPTLLGLPYATSTLTRGEGDDGLPLFQLDVSYEERSVALPLLMKSAPILGFILSVTVGRNVFHLDHEMSLLVGSIFFVSFLALLLARAYLRERRVSAQTVSALNNLKVEHQRAHDANVLTQRTLKQLQTVAEVTKNLTNESARSELLGSVCANLVKILDYDRAIILVPDEPNNKLVYGAHAGSDERIGVIFRGASFDINIDSDDPDKIANIYRSKRPLLIKDVKAHLSKLNAESQAILRMTESRSFVCVPMAGNERCHGVIIADCHLLGKDLTEDDMTLLMTVGQQLSIAIEKMQAQRREVDALQTSIKLRDEFLANTTHELKTPLNGMIGLAESLIDRAENQRDVAAKRNLDLIIASGRRLEKLVDDILSVSKMQSTQLRIERESCDIHTLCDRIVRTFAAQFSKKGLVLRCSVDHSARMAVLDANRIEQVLVNIVGNAFKFTEQGEVSVDVSASGSDLCIAVEDTGIGMNAEDLSRIFEPFYQIESRNDRRFGGVGLGLSIAREIVRLHGGEILVNSKPGEGTKLSFTLPGCVNETARGSVGRVNFTSATSTPENDSPIAAVKEASNASIGKEDRGHILIVDDDLVNLQVLINHLSTLDFHITQATSGQECIDLVNSGLRPDIILMDVMMPGMTGYEACQVIRRTLPVNDFPVLFLTAKSQEQDTLQALQAGGNDFIKKPFAKAEVLARIDLHSKLSRYARACRRFIPWKGLEWLGYKSILDIRLGDAVDLNISVLFSDIRGFTGMTADMPSRDVMRMVNSYVGAKVPIVSQHNGMVDKYLGDGIMALFQKPSEALHAAIAMTKELDKYNERHRQGGDRIALKCRMAVNSGVVTYGPMGCDDKIELTPLSDVINVASRLDGLAKVFGATIVACEHTLMESGLDREIPWRRLGSVPVRGRKGEVSIVEVLSGDVPEVLKQKIASREAFERHVTSLGRGDLPQALEGFLRLAKEYPNDLAVQYFLEESRKRLNQMASSTLRSA